MASTKNTVISLEALVPERYDEQVFEYTGDNLTTITYKYNSLTVAVVTMEYDGDKVTRRYISA